jgi:hypothetical protein
VEREGGGTRKLAIPPPPEFISGGKNGASRGVSAPWSDLLDLALAQLLRVAGLSHPFR